MFIFRFFVLEAKVLVSGYSFVLFFVLITTFVYENVAIVHDIIKMLDLLIVIVFLIK